MTKEIPKEFEWVKARTECSLYAMYKTLIAGLRDDAKARNELRGENDFVRFIAKPSSGRHFSVIREGQREPSLASVDFIYEDRTIGVYDGDGKKRFDVGITLTDFGECKFKIGDEELEAWQVRRKALEPLFF
jgi:hypothetical protein